MSDVERSLTFNDLMAKVGYFLFHWSSFELALADAIVEARRQLKHDPAAVKGAFRERLYLWTELAAQLPANIANADIVRDIRDQALALRDVRNLIVHGFVGGDAQPNDNTPASIRCAIGGFETPTGTFRTYGLAELEHFTQGIDACRRGLIGPDNFNYRVPPEAYE
jgi:hypothetical protein